MNQKALPLFILILFGLVVAQSLSFYGITIPVDETTSDFLSFSTTTTSGNDPSSPSIKITSGLGSKIYVDANDSFDCKNGQLNISVPDGIIGGKIGLFDEAPPYLDMVILPIDGNKSVFTILASSTYSLVAIDFPSYVALNNFRKEFTLCPEEITIPETSKEVVPAENKSIELPLVPEPTPPSISKEDASFAILVANNSISIAITENKDVSAAQAKLTEANLVLSIDDYKQAKKLAEEAFELVKNAKAKATDTAKPATTQTKSIPQQGMDLGIIIISLAAVFVLVLVYFLVIGKKKKRSKKA